MTEMFPAFDARQDANRLAEIETVCVRADLAGTALVHLGLVLALAGFALTAALAGPRENDEAQAESTGASDPACPAEVVSQAAFNAFARRLLDRRAYEN
jgi:hypothetical protein